MLNETSTPKYSTPSETSAGDTSRGVWSQQEHDLFLEALQKYPNGPWKAVAEHVGTRSVRQVQTHAQKYHEKVARRLRGLRKDRKRVQRPEHRLDDEMLEICQDLQQDNALLAPKPAGKRQRQRSSKTMAAIVAQEISERQAALHAAEDETKLSHGMNAVHVTDGSDGEDDATYDASWFSGIEPTDTPFDELDESFFDVIDFLADALSSSDSENGNDSN